MTPETAPGSGYAIPAGTPAHPGVPYLGGPYPPGHPYAPPLAPNGMRLADFGDRLLAYLIDGAILAGIMMVVIFPIFIVAFVALFRSSSSFDPYSTSPTAGGTFVLSILCLEVVLFLFQLAIMYVYFVFYQERKGQTVGKRAMKIKAIPLDPAATLSRRMLQRRFLATHVAALLPGYNLVDGLSQLWDKPYRQCLHDKFAATVVIKLPQQVP